MTAPGKITLVPSCQPGLRILVRAAEMHGMSVKALLARNRTPELARARFAAMLAMQHSGLHLSAIARRMERTHKTIAHGVQRAAHLCEVQPGYADLVEELTEAGGPPIAAGGQ